MTLAQAAINPVTTTVEEKLRAELGAEAFEKSYAMGRESTLEVAVQLVSGRTPATAGRSGSASLRASLTRRENEVATLVADGLTNKEIATKLTISPRTVDAHVDHILTKLGFRSRTQIARWVSADESR
ncbi:helix-turn-helix transcriptional regulator [Gordonia amicalis]|uniref:Helix-turn-helix transcriptional regulator n=3 Tax=Gordonia amicalis TaxID=89053 RepID=A0ABU4D8G9_9ACTN|nr:MULTISPECIES: helix-turn-helix transcriptional regulator [Gordonia]MDV6306024.1 helix-turn-helix transcriptional regulator [Gordonia amicalis]MDV7098689.1 helix-turn-helix transcriptional regulator [Gordonia amicalis]